MANQELTDLQVLAVLATDDIFFVRDSSAGIDKQVAVSSLITLLPPKAIDDLSDVDTTTSTPSPGDHLIWNTTNWVPVANDLIGLTDTPPDYSGAGLLFLRVDSGAGFVEFVSIGLSDLPAIGLDDLSDVSVTTPSIGEHLEWDGASWVPGAAGGGTFLSLSDTPGAFGAADTFFVRVNAGATALEFVADPGYLTAEVNDLSSAVTWVNVPDANITESSVTQHEAALSITESQISDLQAYLLDITAEPIGDLVDVDLVTTPPISGDCLAFTGTVWVPASSMAPGAHETTHRRGGSDELAADMLNIDFSPSNYTPTTDPPNATNVAELGSHLHGIDLELATFALAVHTHVEADITDLQAYLLNINAESIDDLSDVTVTTVAVGEFLRNDGAGQFVNVLIVEADISDLQSYALAVHNHVEADITDLQAYLLDITGENIGDLSDVTLSTPGDGELLRFNGTAWINNTLVEAGIAPTAHTHVEADITDLQLYVLPTDSIDILADVDTTNVTPTSGDCLAWNGSNWVPASSMAPGAHASTHVSLGSDEIDGDVLDIDFVPANYTRTIAPTEVTTLVELTAHLAGIDTRLGGTFTPSTHTHLEADITDLQNYSLVGHTHLEADITDLQAYLLDITAENIGDLFDVTLTTPADGELLRFNGTIWINNTLTEAGIAPTSHTHLEADITDLQAYLLPTDSIDILSDVDTTTLAPSTSDVLTWNGSNWVPASGMAPGAHATTHVSLGSDEIDGDVLDIDFVPANYTRLVSPTEVTTVVELTAHLAGIDAELITFALVSHTHLEADITDLQSYLLPADSIDALSDVDTTTSAPSVGEHLEWDGSNWVPGAAGGGGVTTFVALTDTPADYTGGVGSFFVKVNSGADALEFVADPGFLTDITGENLGDLNDVTISGVASTELLAFTGSGWENKTLAELGIADSSHAATHIFGGSDAIDGDILEITFVPSSYTRDTSPTEVTNVLELTAHLAGIDVAIAAAGSLPKWDRQMAEASNLIQTTSQTFVDLPGLTVTTKDLGSGQDGSYLIHFSASVAHASQKAGVEFRLVVDGVVVTNSITTLNFQDEFLDTQFSWLEDPIVNAKIIKVQWKQNKLSGNVSGMTASMTDRRLVISGVPSNAVVA